MTTLRTGATAVVVAAALLTTRSAGGQAPQPQDRAPVFRAGADVVTVDAAVQNARRPVTGLKASDFELLDNGVAQVISDVSYERLAIDVTMVLDVSASVTGPVLDELRRALGQARADLAAGDRMRLLTFNMGIRRLVDFDGSAPQIDAALASVRGTGSSAVFDGLAVALTAAETPGRRRLIVLFSDGQDSSSISDADTLLEVARLSTTTVTIILGSPSGERPASLLRTSSPLASATVSALCARIANETGGMVTAMQPGENLTSKFRRMVQDFRSSYVLYFTPSGVERQGVHTLDVRVKRSGVDVRARKSYVWR